MDFTENFNNLYEYPDNYIKIILIILKKNRCWSLGTFVSRKRDEHKLKFPHVTMQCCSQSLGRIHFLTRPGCSVCPSFIEWCRGAEWCDVTVGTAAARWKLQTHLHMAEPCSRPMLSSTRGALPLPWRVPRTVTIQLIWKEHISIEEENWNSYFENVCIKLC